MFRSILVPLDGSDLAEQALPLAVSIAERAGAELTLLQVVPLPKDPLALEGTWLSVDEQLELLQGNAREYLKDVARRLQAAASGEPRGLTPKRDTSVGEAAVSIVDYAGAIRADLIIMATHGRSGLSRWALGSVTDRVLQLGHAPMIIVRPQATAPVSSDRLPTLDRIMITLDGSELAEFIFPVATELGRLFHSELVLFRAAVLPAVSYTSPDVMLLQSDLWTGVEAEARAYLQTVASPLQAQGLKVRTLTMPNSVVDSIVAAAEDTDVDLIAMTTHGRSGLNRVVYGSVADRVVRSGVRPVLVVRPPMEPPV